VIRTESLPILRIAIFGGTFDPIHNAHLHVAREAADRLALDRVLFVTAGRPPHKPLGTTTPFEHRHRMVELACAADKRFIPSDLESGGGLSYSIHTIERVRAGLNAEDRLYFLIGADAFAEIGSWHRCRDVIESVEFIVVSRPGYIYPVPEGARVERLETVALPVSSSSIRRSFEAGGKPPDVPDEVAEYAKRQGLYLRK
jgi:nicotinate-nucleotide adenylyltransferase